MKTESLQAQLDEMREALEDLTRQFAFRNDRGQEHTGALSALEQAFDVLGWDDPHDCEPWQVCDEPDCKRPVTCGTPTPKGYRHTCGTHAPGSQGRKD